MKNPTGTEPYSDKSPKGAMQCSQCRDNFPSAETWKDHYLVCPKRKEFNE